MFRKKRFRSICVALILIMPACTGDDETQEVEVSVAATVDAIMAAEPTGTPTSPTAVPTATVDPNIARLADELDGKALAAAFLAERDIRRTLTDEIDLLEEQIVRYRVKYGLEDTDGDGVPEWVASMAEARTRGELDDFQIRWDANQANLNGLHSQLVLKEITLADLDNDGEDPEFELDQFFRLTPGFPEVELEGITSDRLSLEVEAAADMRAAARAERGE